MIVSSLLLVKLSPMPIGGYNSGSISKSNFWQISEAEAPALMLNVTDAPHVEGSEYSFEHLHQNRVSTLDMELKRVLTDDSAARLQEIESKKTINRKLDLLELARNEAEVVAAIRTIEDNEDPEDELNCCWRKRAKEVRQFKKFAEDSEDEGYRITKDEVLMSKAQRIAKWIVILVAISDFILATEDTYLILLRKMQTEYLFLAQIYNCQRLLSSGDDVLIWANVIHCVFCVGLLFMEDKSTCNFGIYWIVSQSIRTFLSHFNFFTLSEFLLKLYIGNDFSVGRSVLSIQIQTALPPCIF